MAQSFTPGNIIKFKGADHNGVFLRGHAHKEAWMDIDGELCCVWKLGGGGGSLNLGNINHIQWTLAAGMYEKQPVWDIGFIFTNVDTKKQQRGHIYRNRITTGNTYRTINFTTTSDLTGNVDMFEPLYGDKYTYNWCSIYGPDEFLPTYGIAEFDPITLDFVVYDFKNLAPDLYISPIGYKTTTSAGSQIVPLGNQRFIIIQRKQVSATSAHYSFLSYTAHYVTVDRTLTDVNNHLGTVKLIKSVTVQPEQYMIHDFDELSLSFTYSHYNAHGGVFIEGYGMGGYYPSSYKETQSSYKLTGMSQLVDIGMTLHTFSSSKVITPGKDNMYYNLVHKTNDVMDYVVSVRVPYKTYVTVGEDYTYVLYMHGDLTVTPTPDRTTTYYSWSLKPPKMTLYKANRITGAITSNSVSWGTIPSYMSSAINRSVSGIKYPTWPRDSAISSIPLLEPLYYFQFSTSRYSDNKIYFYGYNQLENYSDCMAILDLGTNTLEFKERYMSSTSITVVDGDKKGATDAFTEYITHNYVVNLFGDAYRVAGAHFDKTGTLIPYKYVATAFNTINTSFTNLASDVYLTSKKGNIYEYETEADENVIIDRTGE